MRHGIAAAVLATIIVGVVVDGYAQGASNAIRPEDAAIRELLARGVQRSGTFRDLIARRATSDVVAYVRFSPCVGPFPACLVWASPGGAPRRILIKVDRFGGSEDTLTGLLAHELQHASEVAAVPGIIDAASFQRVFGQRGWKGSDGFETAEAQDVTRKVLRELSGSRAA